MSGEHLPMIIRDSGRRNWCPSAKILSSLQSATGYDIKERLRTVPVGLRAEMGHLGSMRILGRVPEHDISAVPGIFLAFKNRTFG